jgi:indole-3-glycerol phosphate synthase
MTDILKEIVAHKKMELAGLDSRALRRAAAQSPLPRDFRAAVSFVPAPLEGASQGVRKGVRLIAELKRASPSRGMLAPGMDLFETAQIYMDNGASALSVLTDGKYFLGQLQTLYDLRFVHHAALPLLRKDFMIAEPQIYEARANGADAVLLIAAALPDYALFAGLHALALDLGLTPLVEVHNETETERALHLPGVRMIGINNRDLATFKVSLETTERLCPLIPADVTVISESGIFTSADVERLAKAKVDAVLVGEALITASDIAAKVRELSGQNVPRFVSL